MQPSSRVFAGSDLCQPWPPGSWPCLRLSQLLLRLPLLGGREPDFSRLLCLSTYLYIDNFLTHIAIYPTIYQYSRLVGRFLQPFGVLCVRNPSPRALLNQPSWSRWLFPIIGDPFCGCPNKLSPAILRSTSGPLMLGNSHIDP